MKKFIDDTTWSLVKALYVSGSATISDIAKKHGISRKSIERKAKKEGWQYGSLSNDVAKAVENATLADIVRHKTDEHVKITDKLMNDAIKIRESAMTIQEIIYNDDGKTSQREANRLLACQRVNECTMKTVTGMYNTLRKALGMDREVEEPKETGTSIIFNIE